MSIGERIKDIRLALGLTVDEFAKSVNMDSTVISKYEDGKKEPGYKFLNQLITIHNVNLKYLFCGEGAAFNRKAGTEEEYKAKMLRSIYPALMDDPVIDRLVESLQVPVMAYTLTAQYLLFAQAYSPFIEKFFKGNQEPA